MSTLKRKADPTFELTVKVPLIGGKHMEVLVTFVGMNGEQFDDFAARSRVAKDGVENSQVIMELAKGWDLCPFEAAAIDDHCREFVGLAPAVVRTFFQEYARVRQGN